MTISQPRTSREKPRRLRIGSAVTVRGSHGRKAVIAANYPSIKGGVRLDREILGFYSWNKEELRPFKYRGAKR